MPDTTVAAFWDDLFIFDGTNQGIFYEIDGTNGTRSFTVEWYMSHYQDSSRKKAHRSVSLSSMLTHP